MQTVNPPFSIQRRMAAWTVHLFTAFAAVVGFLTLVKVYNHEYLYAVWLMGLAVLIDAIDGTFARLVRIKSVLPNIDGVLLDNMVDYLNYVITPMFFIYIKPDMLPQQYALIIVGIVILTSVYQFCQSDAKTPDYFFKGFPCYWNIALFYMFIFETSEVTNTSVLLVLSILIFVPIKYVYPSRLTYLTHSKNLKLLMHAYSFLFGLSLTILLLQYPNTSVFWLSISLSYAFVYLYLSIYRTYYPMIKSKIKAKEMMNKVNTESNKQSLHLLFLVIALFMCLACSAAFSTGLPKGCEHTGYEFDDPFVILNQSGDQTFYLIENVANSKIELQKHETEDIFMSPPLIAILEKGKWAAFASDVRNIHFQCFIHEKFGYNPR